MICELQDQPTSELPAALSGLARSAVDAVPGAQYAGITVADGDTVESFAATHPYASLLDEIQQTHHEGPCLSAPWTHHRIQMNDVASDRRWPRFRRDVLGQTPIKAMLSFELSTGQAGHRTLRALSLYGEQVDAFDERSVEVGLEYATHIAIAWNILIREQQFAFALASRDIIGQAKGIIMERFDVDANYAFELLSRLSQESNNPLAHVAARLVALTEAGDGQARDQSP